MPSYEGRLELTWTNKHKRLLAHDDGSYEWLDPADYRVSEVRLLHDVEAVGAVSSARAKDNLLIRGDALHALTSLTKLPEFSREYLGKVRLAYIDPPFNTEQAFDDYDDNLEHSVWLTMLRDRLIQIKTLLAPNGSVWVHLDDNEVHRCRVVLDEVFGVDRFVGSVIWRSADTGNYDSKRFSEDHNTVLVYSLSVATEWRTNRLSRLGSQASHYKNPDNDPRGPWFDGNPLGSPNHRDNLKFNLVSPTGSVIKHPPHGWRWSRETLEAKLEAGDIRYSADGKRIIYRTYLWEQPGLPPSTLWIDTDDTGSNRKAKNELKRLFGLPSKEVFATPKPESLVKRILDVATDEGDLVLDCFAGSGTTAAVAHKMKRRWVTVEQSTGTIERFTLPRLRKVVEGVDPGGITTLITPEGELPGGVHPSDVKLASKTLEALYEAGAFDEIDDLSDDSVTSVLEALKAAAKTSKTTIWSGGGGFKVLEVAPSMFEADEGLVFLAEGMTNGHLAEATAAQLGYTYQPEPPFAGRKGRSRLAVVDGVVNEPVVQLLVQALPEGERVVICGTGIDPEAREVLRSLRSGSTMRKIPAALLSEYRSARVHVARALTDVSVARQEEIGAKA